MEFWGVEVKSGVCFPVEPKEKKILHLSQASLSDVKENGSEPVYLYATVDGNKFVIGTLSQKFPQIQFDVIFPHSFELSHSSKKGTVCFAGYRCADMLNLTSDDESESEEEELPVIAADNSMGRPKENDKQVKPRAADTTNTANIKVAESKQKVKIVEPKDSLKFFEEDGGSKLGVPSDSSEDVSDSDESEDSKSESVDSETEEEDEEEKEEAPKKVEQSKKRATESSFKTPATAKKAKFVTPQKTESKKSEERVATPYPTKQAGNQSKQQNPKSAGSYSCNPCKRVFKSDDALQSHNKAKHSSDK